MIKNTKKNKDLIGMYYDGGNGGWYALWLALLGTKYRCSFHNFKYKGDPINNKLYEYTWNKKSSRHWAFHEIEVDYNDTISSTYIDHGILLECNDNKYIDIVNKKIVIYADIYTQCLLSIEKHSGIGLFTHTDVTNKDKLIECAHYLSTLIPAVEYNGKQISYYYKSQVNIDEADAAFDLVELVKTNGKPLIEFLQGDTNLPILKKFTKHYIQQHQLTCQELFT